MISIYVKRNYSALSLFLLRSEIGLLASFFENKVEDYPRPAGHEKRPAGHEKHHAGPATETSES